MDPHSTVAGKPILSVEHHFWNSAQTTMSNPPLIISRWSTKRSQLDSVKKLGVFGKCDDLMIPNTLGRVAEGVSPFGESTVLSGDS